MKRAIVTPAVLPAAALSELKQWLGITTSADDALLSALLRAALDLCEDFIGAMPIAQACEELITVSSDWQALTTRPVQSITAVQGIPADGSRFALPVDAYAIELDPEGSGRVLVTNPGIAGRIAVRFVAGIAADWANLPEPLRHGIVRLAAHQHRMREQDGSSATPPAAVAALWRPWRRMRLA